MGNENHVDVVDFYRSCKGITHKNYRLIGINPGAGIAVPVEKILKSIGVSLEKGEKHRASTCSKTIHLVAPRHVPEDLEKEGWFWLWINFARPSKEKEYFSLTGRVEAGGSSIDEYGYYDLVGVNGVKYRVYRDLVLPYDSGSLARHLAEYAARMIELGMSIDDVREKLYEWSSLERAVLTKKLLKELALLVAPGLNEYKDVLLAEGVSSSGSGEVKLRLTKYLGSSEFKKLLGIVKAAGGRYAGGAIFIPLGGLAGKDSTPVQKTRLYQMIMSFIQKASTEPEAARKHLEKIRRYLPEHVIHVLEDYASSLETLWAEEQAARAVLELVEAPLERVEARPIAVKRVARKTYSSRVRGLALGKY